MKEPIISVIMPVYNTKKEYLKEAIDSILNQTFTDFEFLIIDDGSTDPEVDETVRSYSDKRIRYFITANGGASAARNYGLDKATGKYIAILDSDDIALPDRFKKEVEFLEAHPDISIVGGNMEIFNEKGTIRITQMPAEPRLLDFLKENSLQHSTVMGRKRDFEQFHFRYDSSYKTAEDYHLWVQMVKFLKIQNLPDVLVRYRFLEESLSNSKPDSMEKNVRDIKQSILNLLTCDKSLQQKIGDLIFPQNQKKPLLLPRWLGKIICLFIPSKKNRQRFRKNHLKPRKEEKMKIVKLFGGLGNQMFQYAFGTLIHTDAYDLSFFDEVKNHPEWTIRSYELDFWHCHLNFIDKKSMLKLIKNNPVLRIFGIKTKHKVIMEHPNNVYNPHLLDETEGIFDGYFQCAKYYDPIREKLLKDFVPAQPINKENKKILDLITTTNSVSLHVRRGDYVRLQKIHGLCSLDYYKKAVDFIGKHVKNPHFFLFSDDIPWVQENLKIKSPYTIVDINHGKDSAWDMWLMKHCKHNIVANSSFSWWGAWLNENPNKIVIAPKIWFADGSTTDIVPQNWERI